MASISVNELKVLLADKEIELFSLRKALAEVQGTLAEVQSVVQQQATLMAEQAELNKKSEAVEPVTPPAE